MTPRCKISSKSAAKALAGNIVTIIATTQKYDKKFFFTVHTPSMFFYIFMHGKIFLMDRLVREYHR
jgi:hypothetical protein